MSIEFFVYISDIYGDCYNMKPYTYIVKEYYKSLNIEVPSNYTNIYDDNTDCNKVRNFCMALNRRVKKWV